MSYVRIYPSAGSGGGMISGVSGTVGQGNTLTVAGTGLRDEQDANWSAFYQAHPAAAYFTGAKLADGYDRAPGGPGQGCSDEYQSSVRLFSTPAYHAHCQYPLPGAGSEAVGLYWDNGANNQTLYVRFYLRYDVSGGWADNHVKLFAPTGGGEMWYYQPREGASLPSQFVFRDGTTNWYGSIPSGTLQSGRWYCHELYVRTGASPHFTAWIDGTQVIDCTPGNGGGWTYPIFGIINILDEGDNGAPNFSLDAYFASLVCASTRQYPSCVVEIGNSDDYATATKVYQAPVSISDTSVQVTCDLTGLGAGPYYLWVTTNAQVRSEPYRL